jgi:hypothetical protein
MTHSLNMLNDSLKLFHANKAIFLELGVCCPNHKKGISAEWAILKIHKMLHYLYAICWIGGVDRTNTKAYKWLHIDYTKEVFKATNHKDYMAQMMVWLSHQEAVDYRATYMVWAQEQDQKARIVEEDEGDQPDDDVHTAGCLSEPPLPPQPVPATLPLHPVTEEECQLPAVDTVLGKHKLGHGH